MDRSRGARSTRDPRAERTEAGEAASSARRASERDGERRRIPQAVLETLIRRVESEPEVHEQPPVCAGPLLSRSQYLQDLAEGFRDPRLAPLGTMTQEEIDVWTAAAEHDQPASPARSAPKLVKRLPRRDARASATGNGKTAKSAGAAPRKRRAAR